MEDLEKACAICMGPVVNEVLLPCTHSYCSKCLQVRSACPPAPDLIATVLTARFPNLIKLKLNFTCCFCARPEHSNTSSIPICIGTPGSNSASPSAPNRAPHAAHRCPRTNASCGSNRSWRRPRRSWRSSSSSSPSPTKARYIDPPISNTHI